MTRRILLRMARRLLPCALLTCAFARPAGAGDYVFSVRGRETLLNGQPIQVRGLRCSNALISDATADDLIAHLDEYTSHGLNCVSVYFMGSRFGDVKGYREDGALDPVYAARMGRIIEAADRRGMVVLVGCLYWGNSAAKWESWTQREAEAAVANTVSWLGRNDYLNVFVDVDNEGMAGQKFDDRLLAAAGKRADPRIMIATNNKNFPPPPEADLAIHFSQKDPGKPYIETEGSQAAETGGYWGAYSKKDGYYNYINIGVHSEDMKRRHIEATRQAFERGEGYLLTSTWLQCVAPHGPNATPGGDGSAEKPGVRWWLEFIRDTHGPYTPPTPLPGPAANGNGRPED